ncbi:Solute carrier 2 (Facilitated glucose transporter) member, partial [Chamberlinius hualienensis]
MKSQYCRVFLSCLFVCLSCVSYGIVLFYPSFGFSSINSGDYGFKLPINISSWIASFSALFAIPGSAAAALLMDIYGRKFTLIVSLLPMTLGWLLMILSFNAILLGIGRALQGVSIGMVISTVAVYCSEVSPKQ